MKLELGKRYETRNGSYIECIAFNKEDDYCHCKVVKRGSNQKMWDMYSTWIYDKNGEYRTGEGHPHEMDVTGDKPIFLEVGKSYITKDGSRADITSETSDGKIYTHAGECSSTVGAEGWTSDGFYFSDKRDCVLNIIGPWIEKPFKKAMWKKRNAEYPYGGWYQDDVLSVNDVKIETYDDIPLSIPF